MRDVARAISHCLTLLTLVTVIPHEVWVLARLLASTVASGDVVAVTMKLVACAGSAAWTCGGERHWASAERIAIHRNTWSTDTVFSNKKARRLVLLRGWCCHQVARRKSHRRRARCHRSCFWNGAWACYWGGGWYDSAFGRCRCCPQNGLK